MSQVHRAVVEFRRPFFEGGFIHGFIDGFTDGAEVGLLELDPLVEPEAEFGEGVPYRGTVFVAVQADQLVRDVQAAVVGLLGNPGQ